MRANVPLFQEGSTAAKYLGADVQIGVKTPGHLCSSEGKQIDGLSLWGEQGGVYVQQTERVRVQP